MRLVHEADRLAFNDVLLSKRRPLAANEMHGERCEARALGVRHCLEFRTVYEIHSSWPIKETQERANVNAYCASTIDQNETEKRTLCIDENFLDPSELVRFIGKRSIELVPCYEKQAGD